MNRLAAVCSVLALTLAASACAPTVGDEFDPAGNEDMTDDQGSGTTEPEECARVDFMATSVVPSIQLVIDGSGSMANYLPGTTTTRYQAMRDALVGSTGVVQQLQSKVYFGASLYTSDSPCPRMYTTQARMMNNFGQVQQLIDSRAPNGNTPTPDAINAAVAGFAATPAPMGSPPIIVLATDGLPNSCNGGDTQAESVTAAANAYVANIRTFVLGIDGVNDTFLQNVANAGQGVQAGQPNAKFYTANSPQALKDAFEQIIGGVASCELNINGTVDPELAKGGTVTLNGTTLTYGQDWEVVNSTTIRLVGQACEDLKSSPNSQVQASFPCGAVIL